MVEVNLMIKYGHFFSLSHPLKEIIMEEEFMEKIEELHGILNIIVSDRDPIFIGKFWIELFSCLGTQLTHSSSYHPQSIGKIEVVNKFLKGYLHFFASDKQKK